MNKLGVIVMIFLALLCISAVSAENNATDDSVLSEDTVPKDVEINKTASKITSSKVTSYESFQTDVSFKLTSDDKPLVSKEVSILLNGARYTKITDKNGQATLSVNLKKGTYTAEFSYAGDEFTNSTTAKTTVVINNPIKTSLKLGDKDINYRQGSKCLFYVKLLNEKGKAIANQMVTFNVAGKTYSAKTDKNGVAQIFLNLKKGTYNVKYYFKKTAPYLSSSGSFKIKFKAPMTKGNGYWLWAAHMKKISLKNLAKHGTKHIFLHSAAISSYGKSNVVSFIKKAHKYGIKVHLWMQLCYNGKWVSPVKNNGDFKYDFMNSKIRQAVNYAKIKGVDGVHFDYMRYGGTAHKHKNAVESINYMVKKATVKIHNIKPNCIVSGAIMPEPSMMKYYYGQDIPTLSRYVDALLPMVYRGNYHQTRSWIKSVTKTFVRESKGAQIWTGLQTYHSDSNTAKLSQSSLLKDANYAMKGGAKGVILFRIGISCNFNFNKVKS